MDAGYPFWDRAMEFAGAMSRLQQAAEALVGERIEHVIVDVGHPPFAIYEQHPVHCRWMWRWGIFSGVVIWSEA